METVLRSFGRADNGGTVLREKPAWQPVPQTDTGSQGENPEVYE